MITSERHLSDQTRRWLHQALSLGEGESPFPWQLELLRRLLEGDLPRSLDIPTGLGKTATMAIWLVARASGAPLPRRLVYVVDRRAVVDQATEVALGLREWVERTPEAKAALGLDGRALPISTLRGQFVDNREWLEDPSAPAIVVGTVDMVGSRLLFEGYGTSRKMRPYHAAMVGCDALLTLDEAHLVPPFEALLESIATDETLHPQAAERASIPRLRVLSLSATGRASTSAPFTLTEDDQRHEVVRKRLDAKKHLTIETLGASDKLPDALAARAWALSLQGEAPIRCVVFSDRREDAIAAQAALEKLARGVPIETELLVGGRRVRERDQVRNWLAEHGFFPGTDGPARPQGQLDLFSAPTVASDPSRERPAFLFATSAGEVGVDMDAEHMVSDLVAWERMVQRLGRVNRRGDGEARVIVLVPASDEEGYLQRQRVRELLEQLSQGGGEGDASPAALAVLQAKARTDSALRQVIDEASTPLPLRPALTRALADAWSMTSLREHTGRPEVAPWLRGWVEDKPQTAVLWRTHLPVSEWRRLSDSEIEGFFEAAPPHTSELLETETYRVVEWLLARAERMREAAGGEEARARVVAFSLTGAGDLAATYTLGDLESAHKKARERLQEELAGKTLVVDARLGGLAFGLLAPASDEIPPTLDGGGVWLQADPGGPPPVRFRVREIAAGQETEDQKERWRERYRLALDSEEGEEGRWLIVEKWGVDAATEEDRSVARRAQLLAEHQSWAERCARSLAQRLQLDAESTELLAAAARLHDEGKRARRWQRAANVPRDGAIYAKSARPMNTALLDGYRHEFGSLPYAERDPAVQAMPAERRELVLHLIAAHHGFARPVIPTLGCEDAPPFALTVRAQAVALRFARLQRQWGPWGLAWWETLLRAADQQASRENDEGSKP